MEKTVSVKEEGSHPRQLPMKWLEQAVKNGEFIVMSGEAPAHTFRCRGNPRYRVTVSIEDVPDLLRPGGSVTRFADAYVDGVIGFEGDMIEAVRDIRSGLTGFFKGSEPLSEEHTPEKDEAFVSHHYDLSNDFFRTWLDDRMIYSCAFFGPGGLSEGIDRAQVHKLQIICGKLDLPKRDIGPSRPLERVLDIGCGWGGLALWMAAYHDVHVTGVSLSREQLKEAHARVRGTSHAIAGRVDLRKIDYRHLEGKAVYDKIVSVGMAEHVGRENLGKEFFPAVARLLRPGGRYLHHVICASEGYDADGGHEWLRKHVFPGSEFSTAGETIRAAERSGLHVRDQHDWGWHYARTLRCWYDRFTAKRDQLIALAGEKTVRAYELYLAACAEAFVSGRVTIAQFLFTKNGADRPELSPFHEMSFMG